MMSSEKEMSRLLKRDEEAEEEIEKIVRNPRVFGGTLKVMKLLERLSAVECEIVTAMKEGWWLSHSEIEEYHNRAKYELWYKEGKNDDG